MLSYRRMTKKKYRKIKKNNMEKKKEKKKKCSKLSDPAHCTSELIFTAEYCWSKLITQPASQLWVVSIYLPPLLFTISTISLSSLSLSFHITFHHITSLTSNCLWEGHDLTCNDMLRCLTQHTHTLKVFSIVQYDDICCTYDLLFN